MDTISQEQRSQLMSRVRSADTWPEMVVRRRLHAAGLRYRLHRRDLPGRPDIVLPRLRQVIFVHGCYWHGHDACDRGTRRPKSNSEFWARKLDQNRARDARVAAELRAMGWTVVIVWECQAKELSALDKALEPVWQARKEARGEDGNGGRGN